MKIHTQEDLDEAITAITSTIKKIEKVSAKEALKQSQKTLMDRRLKALKIARELIEEKLKEINEK